MQLVLLASNEAHARSQQHGTKRGPIIEHCLAQVLRRQTMTDQSNQAISADDYQLTIADLTAASGLTDQYDTLLLSLCDTQAHSTSLAAIQNTADSNTRYCHHLRHALESDTVYICNRGTLNIVATSSTESPQQCSDTEVLHTALTTMVSDLWNCEGPIYLPEIAVFPESKKLNFIVTPLDESNELLLIAVDSEINEKLVSNYFSGAITGLYQIFQNHKTQQPKRQVCESHVFDYLQAKFQNSSSAITSRRMKNFKQQLAASPVSFNSITPLANNSLTNSNQISNQQSQDNKKTLCSILPDELYTIAKLWGTDFKVVLDSHCLTESSYGYKTLCENHELLKFETSRALQLKVHTQTLRNPNYTNILEELTEKCVIHSSRILFNLISDTNSNQSTVMRSDQLDGLQLEHNAPKRIKKSTAAVAPLHNIADEFDLMGTNGIRQINKSKKLA